MTAAPKRKTRSDKGVPRIARKTRARSVAAGKPRKRTTRKRVSNNGAGRRRYDRARTATASIYTVRGVKLAHVDGKLYELVPVGAEATGTR